MAYCFDTDVISAALRRNPPLGLIRRLATIAPSDQYTTAITLGELLWGAHKSRRPGLVERVRSAVRAGGTILPFDEDSAEIYAQVRATLETAGRRLDEPDLRIASIALRHDLVLVSGNVRHFGRVPGLRLENWLA